MTEQKAEMSSTEQVAGARGFRKTREGLVVSDKMDKTVVVAVEDRVKHALYGQVIRREIARIYTIMRERELGLSIAPTEVAS
jgi:hypothetical protein